MQAEQPKNKPVESSSESEELISRHFNLRRELGSRGVRKSLVVEAFEAAEARWDTENPDGPGPGIASKEEAAEYVSKTHPLPPAAYLYPFKTHPNKTVTQ